MSNQPRYAGFLRDHRHHHRDSRIHAYYGDIAETFISTIASCEALWVNQRCGALRRRTSRAFLALLWCCQELWVIAPLQSQANVILGVASIGTLAGIVQTRKHLLWHRYMNVAAFHAYQGTLLQSTQHISFQMLEAQIHPTPPITPMPYCLHHN